ncbi:hypothetical protein ACEU2D_18315 [Brevibacillus laterosporus]|uniref:hypothetical protein n=1 Tax=Brevibacillus laterosporus TaxID=1465 RepID=UPI0035A61291
MAQVLEMSVTRGLAELKLLKKRIEDTIDKSTFASYSIGQKIAKGYKSIEEFEVDSKAKFDSVKSLIKQRNAIKSAIVESNAKTIIKIGELEMTVAEAIERKTSIEFDRLFLQKLRNDFHVANQIVEHKNTEVNASLQRLLESQFNGKDGKIQQDTVELISKPYKKNNEAKLVDPINLRKIIEEMQNEIDKFDTEVDFVLSESNSLTKIKITV